MADDTDKKPSERRESIEARNQMFRVPRFTHERAAAAGKLLKLMLDPAGVNKKRGFDLRVSSDLPPRIADMATWFAQRYPGAGVETAGVYTLPDTPKEGDTLGTMNLLGGMRIRDTLNGKPRPLRELRSTILHELSHGLRAPDYVDHETKSKRPVSQSPVSSYEVGLASDYLGDDINLPLEGELLKRAKAK